jgi:hypothetical protein
VLGLPGPLAAWGGGYGFIGAGTGGGGSLGVSCVCPERVLASYTVVFAHEKMTTG